MDLKSIRNSRAIGFADACRRAISDLRYDVQVEHYARGRQALRQFIREGTVFGGATVDAAWLERVAAVDTPAWVFVFWQAEGAPLTWACSISPGNGVHDVARNTILKAEDNYRSYMGRFGPDMPWVLNEPIEELAIEDMPAWYGRA